MQKTLSAPDFQKLSPFLQSQNASFAGYAFPNGLLRYADPEPLPFTTFRNGTKNRKPCLYSSLLAMLYFFILA